MAGHISKQGNSLLRYLLVDAAQAAARINPEWKRRYLHLAMRRHRSIVDAEVKETTKTTLQSEWRRTLKKNLTGPKSQEIPRMDDCAL
jgi:transposase